MLPDFKLYYKAIVIKTVWYCTVTKVWKRLKCPLIDEWIKKMQYIYTMDYHSSIKKNNILPFVTIWMKLEGIMLIKVSQRKTNTV